MAQIASLLISFRADVKSLRGEFAKVRKEVTGLNKLAKLATAAIGGLVGGKIVASIGRNVKAFADYNDSLLKTSRALGISAQSLSEFRFIAERTGTDVRTFDQALQRMQRRLGEVATFGRGEALKALEALGGGLADSARAGADFETLLPRIAERLGQVEGATKRLAIAQKLADSEGAQPLLKFVESGALGLRELQDEFRALAGTIDTKALGSTEKFNDVLTNLGTVFEGIKRQVLPGLIAALSEFGRVVLDTFDLVRGRSINVIDRLNEAIESNNLFLLRRALEQNERSMGRLQAQAERARESIRDIGEHAKRSGIDLAEFASTLEIEEGLLGRLESRLVQQRDLGLEAVQALLQIQLKYKDVRKEGVETWDEVGERLSLFVKQAASKFQLVENIAKTAFTRITSGISDALFRAAQQAGNFADTFRETIVSAINAILRSLLEFVIQFVAAQIVQIVFAIVANESKRSGIIGALVGLAAAGAIVGATIALANSQKRRSREVASLQEGGVTTSEGFAFLHPGEIVGDLDRVARLFGGAGNNRQVINLVVDGSVLTRQVLSGMPREVNLRMGGFA